MNSDYKLYSRNYDNVILFNYKSFDPDKYISIYNNKVYSYYDYGYDDQYHYTLSLTYNKNSINFKQNFKRYDDYIFEKKKYIFILIK